MRAEKDKKMAEENHKHEREQEPPVVEDQVEEITSEAEVSVESDATQNGKDKVKRINRILSFVVPLLILSLALGLWYLFTFNWNNWEARKTIQTTDNATVQADIIPLSTRATGTVETVNIKDYQAVKEGDVLVTLRSNDVQATVEQAQAGINSAQEALNNIQLQKQQQEDRIKQAQLGVEVAQADLNTAQIGLNNVQNDIASARIGIETASDDVRNTEAGIEAVGADVDRTTQERTRQENLFKAQATTKQRLELAVAENERVLAGLKSRQLDKAKAEGLVRIRQQDLSKAQNLERVRVQDLRKARTQLGARQNDLSIALKQLEVLHGQERQLQEDLKAKQANLTIANTNFDYTKILAPRDGIVGEVKVKPGQQLGPGAQVASLVSSEMWVIANFKETQIANMKEGDPVEIVIDAFSGMTVKGKLSTLSPASGSEFSLIPPENASGSYTRVTQRVPVKIVFESNQPVTEKLRPGMSATVTVMVGSSRKKN
jgi:membrane fusion protein (multidrug efflux system)